MSVEKKMAWIERGGAIALSRQCELAGVARASVYRRTIEREQNEEDLLLCRLIDEEYTRRPFYLTSINAWQSCNFCLTVVAGFLNISLSHGPIAQLARATGS